MSDSDDYEEYPKSHLIQARNLRNADRSQAEYSAIIEPEIIPTLLALDHLYNLNSIPAPILGPGPTELPLEWVDGSKGIRKLRKDYKDWCENHIRLTRNLPP
jgi:hypothetical protein